MFATSQTLAAFGSTRYWTVSTLTTMSAGQPTRGDNQLDIFVCRVDQPSPVVRVDPPMLSDHSLIVATIEIVDRRAADKSVHQTESSLPAEVCQSLVDRHQFVPQRFKGPVV